MGSKLSTFAIEEIRCAMRDLDGRLAKRRAEDLAERYNCSVNTVYSLSKDVRPARKPRADAGNRKAGILQDEALRTAASLVVKHKISPKLAKQVVEMKGMNFPLALTTFRRVLRENQISRPQLESRRQPHRRFEAEFPCQLFQLDASGLKVRWLDLKTRKLFTISKLNDSRNHPNKSKTQTNVWGIVCVDDYSRRIFVYFYAVKRLSQVEMIDFVLRAFRVLGVPLCLYTDNDKIIIGDRMKRAAEILNSLFTSSGGFVMQQHKPGNPKATGKVEVIHRIVDEYDRVVPILQDRSIEGLNDYAELFCLEKNHEVHRSTGVPPMLRWREGFDPVRIPPPQELDNAFQADPLTRLVRPDLTIEVNGTLWQLPRKRPFVDWAEAGKKVDVFWPPADRQIFWIMDDGDEYEIPRVEARPDSIGPFKALPQSSAQKLREELGNTPDISLSPEDLRARKAQIAESQPAILPKKTIQPTAETMAAMGLPGVGGKQETPAEVVPLPVRPDPRYERPDPEIDEFRARLVGITEGYFHNPITEDEKTWCAQIFAGRPEIPESEFQAALKQRGRYGNLTAVKN